MGQIGYKLFLSAFSAIFVAELADKTQLVNIGLTSKYGKPWIVWTASSAAYIVVAAVSIFGSAFLSQHIKPEVIRYFSACVFILIGVLMIFNKL